MEGRSASLNSKDQKATNAMANRKRELARKGARIQVPAHLVAELAYHLRRLPIFKEALSFLQ